MPGQAATVETTAAALDAARAGWGETGETELPTGLEYAEGHAVRIHVRKRGHRYDLSDDGAAVAKAGKPPGWLDLAEEVVAEQGFNVNRTGNVFVPAVEGRDLASLALRLAACSVDVHSAIVELRDLGPG